jgi:hypothetical protein
MGRCLERRRPAPIHSRWHTDISTYRRHGSGNSVQQNAKACIAPSVRRSTVVLTFAKLYLMRHPLNVLQEFCRLLVVATAIAAAATAGAATLAGDPYVPGEGREKIASDLALPVGDIIIDRRCVYTRTDQWVAKTTVKTMSTCTVLATPTRLILANYDRDRQSYIVDISFDYTQLKSVALSAKEDVDPSIYLDGRKVQVQFETEQGFISLTAWRSPPKVKPFDPRGADDLFELIKSKGVAVSESNGLVEVAQPSTFQLLRNH